ncbi:hypothetical protein BT63DRAFT_479397 [Microthyrium microscopicum]|uniref:Uncharacterized protein n=1 Tax=Microthyrium microscopicum TaxID=703497 RepID=A0A6A6UCK4_9PEZI|nr:hypothetical protein BT63DRAFT_479397 [Microthyrium microscopicum]
MKKWYYNAECGWFERQLKTYYYNTILNRLEISLNDPYNMRQRFADPRAKIPELHRPPPSAVSRMGTYRNKAYLGSRYYDDFRRYGDPDQEVKSLTKTMSTAAFLYHLARGSEAQRRQLEEQTNRRYPLRVQLSAFEGILGFDRIAQRRQVHANFHALHPNPWLPPPGPLLAAVLDYVDENTTPRMVLRLQRAGLWCSWNPAIADYVAGNFAGIVAGMPVYESPSPSQTENHHDEEEKETSKIEIWPRGCPLCQERFCDLRCPCLKRANKEKETELIKKSELTKNAELMEKDKLSKKAKIAKEALSSACPWKIGFLESFIAKVMCEKAASNARNDLSDDDDDTIREHTLNKHESSVQNSLDSEEASCGDTILDLRDLSLGDESKGEGEGSTQEHSSADKSLPEEKEALQVKMSLMDLQ